MAEETIIRKPREDDVLLGQGHYRHPGNKLLNKIVDEKVDEYKIATRPFKTYMAHDIIQRLRNKGVRFLKELAPKGWIIVKDDREAREKVAQRFQYMMRKQADNNSSNTEKSEETVVIKNTATFPETPLESSTATTPAPLSQFVWKGTTVKVPFLPVFHQLHRTSVMVDDDIVAVPDRLLDCFGTIGVQDSFNYDQANAVLTVPKQLTIHMNLWKPLGGNKGIIVELINLVGDIMVFHKYTRYILEAATGLFGKYKQTLIESRILANASVRDQVTIYSANMVDHKKQTPQSQAQAQQLPSGNRGQEDNATNTTTVICSKDQLVVPSIVKPGTVKSLTDRVPAKEGNKIKTTTTGSPVECPKERKDGSKPIATKRPSVKCYEPKIPLGYNDAPKVEKESSELDVDKVSLTGNFASAFSRWETGIEAAEKSVTPATRKADPKRWPSVASSKEISAAAGGTHQNSEAVNGSYAETAYAAHEARADFRRWPATGREQYNGSVYKPYASAVDPPSPPKKIGTGSKRRLAAAKEAYEQKTAPVTRPQPFKAESSGCQQRQRSNSDTKEMEASAKTANEQNYATACKRYGMAAEFPCQTRETKTVSGRWSTSSGTNNYGQGSSSMYGPAQPEVESSEPTNHIDKKRSPSSFEVDPEPIRRLSITTAGDTKFKNMQSTSKDPFTPYPFSKYPATHSDREEMKCDSSLEYKQEAEVASMDQTIESIKRLSISSNDASYCEKRTGADRLEAFPTSLWSNAFPNQEMKCDSSFDDDPYADGSLSSQQSFIPSSFFGPGAPGFSRSSNAPSPANSFCSHISVEMRSLPSPSNSFNSHLSVEIFSLPSPCGSAHSRCSLGVESLKNARMDEALSPTMFQSDQSADQEKPDQTWRNVHTTHQYQRGHDELDVGQPHGAIPPTIFVESCPMGRR